MSSARLSPLQMDHTLAERDRLVKDRTAEGRRLLASCPYPKGLYFGSEKRAFLVLTGHHCTESSTPFEKCAFKFFETAKSIYKTHSGKTKQLGERIKELQTLAAKPEDFIAALKQALIEAQCQGDEALIAYLTKVISRASSPLQKVKKTPRSSQSSCGFRKVALTALIFFGSLFAGGAILRLSGHRTQNPLDIQGFKPIVPSQSYSQFDSVLEAPLSQNASDKEKILRGLVSEIRETQTVQGKLLNTAIDKAVQGIMDSDFLIRQSSFEIFEALLNKGLGADAASSASKWALKSRNAEVVEAGQALQELLNPS